MGQILGRVVQESRGFVTVGDCRWHFRSVGQSDYYKAFYGNLVLINKAMDPEAAKVQDLPDDHPDKLQSWIRMLDKMGIQGQEEMAMRQRTAVSAGLEGVSLLSEVCSVVQACYEKARPYHAELLEKIPSKLAPTKAVVEIAKAQEAYELRLRQLVAAVPHACSSECFPQTYEAITFVPKVADANPLQGRICIDSIPPVTITAVFGGIMALGDEGGRAARRVQTFPSGPVLADDPAPGGRRVRRETERASARAARAGR